VGDKGREEERDKEEGVREMKQIIKGKGQVQYNEKGKKGGRDGEREREREARFLRKGISVIVRVLSVNTNCLDI